jgi:hypothetical protein
MYRALVLYQLDEFKKLSEEIGIKDWKILGMMILFRPVEGYIDLVGWLVGCAFL